MDMKERTRLGLGVLSTGLLLGVLGDALLRAKPWGLNVFLWIGMLMTVLLLLVHWGRIAVTSHVNWLAFTAFLFAAVFAWRDSITLKLLDVMALLICLALLALHSRAGSIRRAGLMEYALEAASTGLYTVCGFLFLLFSDIEWKEITGGAPLRRAMALGRGFVIAVPLLLLFTGLFMAADAVFEGMVNEVLNHYFDKLFTHIFVTGFCAWVVGGFLRGTLVGKELVIQGVPRPKSLWLGIAEIGIVLGLLDLLFLCFIIVQFRYFFGGAAQIGSFTKLTYAEYARRGFFELVTVAMLVLPLLLGSQWLLRKDNPFNARLFQGLAGIQIVMLFVIMASALQRMLLYQNEYGLTELRLYTTAFMGWLAVVFIWFTATVLHGHRERFAFGAMMAGFVWIVALHLFNPEDFIVRTNVARAGVGHSFDVQYATSLSADTVPGLVAALPILTPQGRYAVAGRILERWSRPQHPDWRTWNRSRAKAWQVVRDNEVILREMACHHR